MSYQLPSPHNLPSLAIDCYGTVYPPWRSQNALLYGGVIVGLSGNRQLCYWHDKGIEVYGRSTIEKCQGAIAQWSL